MPRELHGFARTVAMLLIAVLVAVPVADAFACSLELESSHAAVHASERGGDPVPATQGDEGDAERPHGVCAHNHCHHTTANVPVRVALSQDMLARSPGMSFEDDGRPQHASDGLMRPPRI
ncbi:hypothetical protein [Luteimonas abyssi]|uniref:hypothetical protein n=1 Tax=Luteimonas abyssi TaxID=1247514 RepID=UPI000737D5C2|nr:hypothetical protein [Luteimonas abyssi]